MADKIIVTKDGKEKMEKRLKELKEVLRPKTVEWLKDARAQGDLSENAEYDAAKDALEKIDEEMAKLSAQLKSAEVGRFDSKKVKVGAKVTANEVGKKKEEIFYIVGPSEANSLEDKISYESPFGKAFLNKEVGEIATILAPRGEIRYRIKKIEKA